MISSEVQRTLVKSPPELWAELSDPAALARHLGELGEIRIIRTESEKTVEWEAENTTGTVSIQPSGWGTRVTLSVTKEVVRADAQDVPEPDVIAKTGIDVLAQPGGPAAFAVEPNVEPDVLATEPTSEVPPDVVPELEAPAEPEAAATEPRSAEAAPAPRRGFFARLFGRKRSVEVTEPQPSVEQAPATDTKEVAANMAVEESSDPFAAVREALSPESIAAIDLFAPPATQPAPQDALHTPETEQQPDTKPEQIADIAAELRAAEEVLEEEVTAVLAAVLDRLGAAHHRPFSRA
jgi:hypothetical protein